MREKILNLLKEIRRQPLTPEELKEKLGIKRGLEKEVKALEEEGLIFLTKNGKIALSEAYGYELATIIKATSKGLIAQVGKDEEKKTYNIAEENSMGAIYQDRVLISRKGTNAHVYKIVKAYDGNIVGEVMFGRHSPYLHPLESSFPLIDLDSKKMKNAQEGHRVVVKISRRLPRIIGEVTTILGHKNDPKVDVLSLAYQANVPLRFSEEVLQEVEQNIPSEISYEELKDRVDLTERLIVTIDGEDAKDLDDAIECHKNPDGTYYLGVHIADVSHYVTKFSLIDREAFKRGTSIYLTDYVIPMLPHALSNGICSLNPGVLRLTKSCEMTIDGEGKVVDYEIYDSYIKSSQRLNYTEVNAFYKGKHEFEPDLAQMLNEGLELSHILRKMKEKRGTLDLDIGEAKIVVDETGFPVDIFLRVQDEGEKLIEDFMVAANETVANHIYWQSLPFVYRVHDKPKLAKLNEFCRLIEARGYNIKLSKKGIHPLELQSLLTRTKDDDIHNVVSSLLLRSLAKAVYQTENIGHFGLASSCYTHFTAPIRRYPDLMVHRLLKQYSERKPSRTKNLEKDLEFECSMASLCERRAIELERQVDDLKKAEYMEDKIGQLYEGRISGMINSGFFVQLPNTIEGLVKFSDLMDDYYIFDEKRMIAIGEGSQKIYKLGDKVKVEVKSASKELRKIDFLLVERI